MVTSREQMEQLQGFPKSVCCLNAFAKDKDLLYWGHRRRDSWNNLHGKAIVIIMYDVWKKRGVAIVFFHILLSRDYCSIPCDFHDTLNFRRCRIKQRLWFLRGGWRQVPVYYWPVTVIRLRSVRGSLVLESLVRWVLSPFLKDMHSIMVTLIFKSVLLGKRLILNIFSGK